MRSPALRSAVILLALVVGSGSWLGAAEPAADGPDPGPYDALEYRLIGPAAGGRAARVTGVAGDPLTFWLASAAGGVWKSVNGGRDWEPVFDDQPVSSIGSIAVAPSDPNVVWVGTGEANIRGNVAEGNGIYRSTDGGDSWRHVWRAEGQIGTIIVHPDDPDVAFAAVLGSPFGPGEQRGILRTTDGGASWQRVLFVDPDTGASDVCFDPANPRILFAGTWQTRRTPWGMTSGGPGSGLWTSRDGGDSWSRLTGHGLPEGIWGKVGVRVAPSDPRRVYALIEAEEGGLFRSDDGGESWRRVNPSRGLQQRAWYYTTLTVDPHNADVVWFPQVRMLRSVDGGETVRSVKGGGWDYHDIWVDPVEPRRLAVASDAGVSLSSDDGATWYRPAIPMSQFYHLSVDTRRPYRVLGALQDQGTVSGPSRTLHGGGILLSDWHPVGGGEAGYVVADPSDPDIVWAGEYMGYISRWDGRTRQAPNVGIDPDDGSGMAAADKRYRFQWTAPIVVSPHDPATVYHAANVLFRTTDGGQTWAAISPDLTRDDESKQGWAGGPITGDNTGVEWYDTIFAVAESPLQRGLIWTGSDDGLVHVTADGGGSWSDVTPPDLPEWATVQMIEASRWDAATAYVVADAHRLDDESPYLWRTTDRGASWKRLDGGLDPEAWLHVVREDSSRRGMLYLGTERGVMVSRDDGASWQSLRLNLPTVAVVDLVVAGDDLVVGTLGRSAWILDDLTAVRELSPAIRQAPAHLFAPRPTVAWYLPGGHGAPLGSRAGAGEDPPEGALLTYWLAAAPDGPVELEVRDDQGHLVRTLRSELEPLYTSEDQPDWSPGEPPEPDLATAPGLHRTAWDLRWERPRWPADSRSGSIGEGPRAVPGTYQLTLRIGDTVTRQSLTVEPDPRRPADPEARAAQLAFQLEQRDRMTHIAELVDTIRAVREQVDDLDQRLADDERAVELVTMGEALVSKLDAIEAALHSPAAEVDYDVLAGRHGGAKLYTRLIWLASGGDAHDGPPTQGMREVAAELGRELEVQQVAFEQLLAGDLAAFEQAASRLGTPYVVVP